MKNTFSRMTVVALTMWFGLAAGTANAVPFITSFSGSPSAGYSAAFGNTGVTSPFSDWHSFSIPAGGTGNGSSNVISLGAANVIFTLFELYDGLTFLGSGATGGTTSSLSFSGGTVPGSYSLYVDGYKVNTALSGSYAGNISVSPVPEPGIYAMMLAGLGLLGFSARRRKNNG